MSTVKTINDIVSFMAVALQNSNCNGFALGLSGGIDSAVCAALAKKALERVEHNLHEFYGSGLRDSIINTRSVLDLIILPIGNIGEDANVAQEVADSIGVSCRTVNLEKTFEQFKADLGYEDGNEMDVKSLGNLKARMRMSAIYFAANTKNLMVIGTDNRSETYTGYFTKHGDGAADIFPISAFTKREVYEIGRALGLPYSVLTRAPSAGLWEGQTDEKEMGVPYDFIDNHLEGMDEANTRLYGSDRAFSYRSILHNLHKKSAHKRNPPLVFKP